MILCAGHGTRLRPLTSELPKPLVPVGDRSILAHVVDGLRRFGVENLVVNAHHLADRLVDAARSLNLRALREGEILGTAGGVANAAGALGAGDVIVVNGDILAELDFEALVERHAQRQPFATLAVSRIGRAGEGTVGLDDDARVVRLRGERFGEETRSADFVGVQLLSARARGELPSEGCLVGDLYLPALRRGVLLEVAEAASGFWDVGTPEAYLDCNLDWLGRRGSSVWVSGSVSPEVQVERSIVGAGANVIGAGELRNVVVWPGGTARAPLQNAIVSPRHVVQLENL